MKLERLLTHKNLVAQNCRVSWELEIRQTHVLQLNLISSLRCVGQKPLCAIESVEIVLVDTVAAHAKSAHHHSVLK